MSLQEAGPNPSGSPSEEVSLRDLYLLVLRGLPVILGLAVLAGVLAFLYNASREPVYAAQSTVLVTPPPIEIEADENLSFSPSNEVSFETYETLARSQLVLEDAVARLPEANVSPNQLLSLGSVVELIGPQRPDQIVPLSVVHRVRNANPELAARLANAWAQSTLEAVRESLFASLSPVDATTEREVARLQAAVEEVEERVRAFEAEDDGAVLEARLSGLTRQLTEGRARLAELGREIAASEARRRALRNQLRGAEGVTTAQGGPEARGALLETLMAQRDLNRERREAAREVEVAAPLGARGLGEFAALSETLDEETARALNTALERQGEAAREERRARAGRALQGALMSYALQVEAPEDIIPLLSRADLRAETVSLSGTRAARAALQSELEGYRQEAARIQRQTAALNQQRGRLERELESALGSYNRVADLQASVSYLTELAPTNARILSQASVPSSPVGPRWAFNTVLATTLGALLGLLFVFLRAAVRQPGASGTRPVPVKGSL